MTEEELRAKEADLLKERKSLECRLAEVRESLDFVRLKLLPFSQAQKSWKSAWQTELMPESGHKLKQR